MVRETQKKLVRTTGRELVKDANKVSDGNRVGERDENKVGEGRKQNW